MKNNKLVGAFVKIEAGDYKVLSSDGEYLAQSLEFSSRFHRQVKLYCYPFKPGAHLLNEIIFEFSISRSSSEEMKIIIQRIVGDNREKEWNRWVLFLRSLGPKFQGQKVEGSYAGHGIHLLKSEYVEYSTPVCWQEAIIDLVRRPIPGGVTALKFSNGVLAVRAFGRVGLWKRLPQHQQAA